MSAHPIGIGRGAFDPCFPVYRELKTSYPLRFAYVENEPLQLLIDSGWLMFGRPGRGGSLVHARGKVLAGGDRVEAALVAGLVAVHIHSCARFRARNIGGPAAVHGVLAVLLGRLRDPASAAPLARLRARGLCRPGRLIIGVAVHAREQRRHRRGAESRVTDVATNGACWRALRPPTRSTITTRWRNRAPELLPAEWWTSPRLHTLNRAASPMSQLRAVHAEVARNLWALATNVDPASSGAMLSIQPHLFDRALGELFAAGATPAHLAAVASFDVSRMVDVADFLNGQGRIAEALAVLDQADTLGANRVDSLIVRARLQLPCGPGLGGAGDADRRGGRPRSGSPGPFLLKAETTMAAAGGTGVEEALATLDTAATRYPFDVQVQRARMRLVLDHKRWQASARAVDGLQAALYHAQGTASEAHVAAARVQAGMGHVMPALTEYRIALADDPANVGLWVEFGRTAQAGGRSTIAREALLQASHLSPQNPEIAKLLHDMISKPLTQELPAWHLQGLGAP